VAVSCGIYLRERGNESGNLFNIEPYCTAWQFQLLRRNGCGPATFTAVMTDAQWATLEATGLIETDTIVHFYLKMNEAAEHRCWSGTLKSFPLDKSTPPDRRRRSFTCSPVWTQLKAPGCIILNAFDADETVQEIVQGLIDPATEVHIGICDDTDVSSSTAAVLAGDDFAPGRTLFIDQDAASCIEKCAQVYGDVVYGVSGSDDVLYFVDETDSEETAVATFRQGTHADGVVKFSRITQVRAQQANHYIVEGREAKSGNPMTVEYEDPDLSTDANLLRRTKKVKAPDNVKGVTLLRWATYLVERDKGAKTVATLDVAGINTKFTAEGQVIRTYAQVNGNIAVEDEDGNPLGQWPIQSVTYKKDGRGAYDAAFQLGDELKHDLVDALGIRDTLREIAVYDLKEFSNQVELNAMNDDWLETAYVFFVLNHGMRNSVRISLQSLRHIDFENSLTEGILVDVTDDGISGLIVEDDASIIGQFVTQEIPVGMHFDQWALLRNNEYPRIIEGQEGAGAEHFWWPTPLPPHDGQTYEPHWHSIVKECQYGPIVGLNPRRSVASIGDGTVTTDNYGVALYRNTVHPTANIDWACYWQPPRDMYNDAAYIVFGYTDHNNYHFIEIVQGFGIMYEGRIWFKGGKYVDGVLSWSSTVAGSHLIGGSGEPWHNRFNFRIEPDVDTNSYTFKVRKWDHSGDTGWWTWGSVASEAGWFTLSEATHAVGVGQRWDALPPGSLGYDISPIWQWLKFDGATAGDEWYISRDGGDSWEGPFDPDTGDIVDLGAYAGEGDEADYILIKGYVAFPQLLTGYAVGWKNA